MERWVINASPIICLAKAGFSDLLVKVPEEIVVPRAVMEEIQAGKPGDPAQTLFTSGMFPWIDVSPKPEILAWDLGKGESAVLSYALSDPGWIAIIDDRAARKCARSFSIPFKGTLAVVILAKKQGLIESAADVVRALQASGLRIDEEVIRTVLQQTLGETW